MEIKSFDTLKWEIALYFHLSQFSLLIPLYNLLALKSVR